MICTSGGASAPQAVGCSRNAWYEAGSAPGRLPRTLVSRSTPARPRPMPKAMTIRRRNSLRVAAFFSSSSRAGALFFLALTAICHEGEHGGGL